MGRAILEVETAKVHVRVENLVTDSTIGFWEPGGLLFNPKVELLGTGLLI